MTNFEKIYSDPDLNSSINDLLFAFANTKFSRQDYAKNDFKKLRKAGWLCSMLAESQDENHQRKAQLFAILLHLTDKNNYDKDRLSYVILSRMGNLLATKFLTSLYDKNISDKALMYDFGALLNHEIIDSRINRIIQIEDEEILTTSFQLELWKQLSSNTNIAISAPTSAGKSFIIQKFINEIFKDTPLIQGLYIVPTKALINQASEDLRRILDDTEIKTSFIQDEVIENAEGEKLMPSQFFPKLIYVLTPERCLKLLQNSRRAGFDPQFIFADEIQNVEDPHGRGTLFEYVLEGLALLFPEAKIITAGPFINNEATVFKEIFNLDAKSCSTDLSPGVQLRTIIRNLSNKKYVLELTVKSSVSEQAFELSIPVDFDLNSELKKNKGIAFAKVIISITKNEQQSIVYCSQPNYVENWALRLEELSAEVEEKDEEIEELIEFLAEEIHPKYFLIKCLKKSIAFHHSKLPDVARREIEDLFKDGSIHTLYCTSTLLQGVNLPANNLFITSPKKRNLNLSAFEFGNLIGRAGRIKDSLYGIVYCIEDSDEDKQWAESFYGSSFKKEIIPATRKALENEDLVIVNINNPSTLIKEDDISYAIIILRQRFLKSPETFKDYLLSKFLNESYANQVNNLITQSLSEIKIQSEVSGLNPTIDPVLQNILYNRILEEGIENWVIIPNSNFYTAIKKDYLQLYEYKELSFYWQLATLCDKLNSIFNITNDLFKQDIKLSTRQIAFYGYRWLQNQSLKDIILEDIKFHAERIKDIDPDNDSDINGRINEVINIHTKVITFILVKYFKLLVDILENILSEEQKLKYRFTLSLPIMIELGTTEPIVIQLMSKGITRSVALKLFEKFKRTPNYKENDIFIWMKNETNLTGLTKIYVRYLKKLKFITPRPPLKSEFIDN